MADGGVVKKVCWYLWVRRRLLAATAVAVAAAIAARFLAGDPAANDGAGTTDPGVDAQGLAGAVADAGTALHAAVQFDNARQAVLDNKDRVGTDRCAELAADTFFGIQFQGRYPAQIKMFPHNSPVAQNAAHSHRTRARTTAASWAGIARRISFSTPEGEV